MAEPYVNWDEVARSVQGVERLQNILLPHVETADDHPFFDEKLAVAQRQADVDLEEAGYEIPLETVTDPLFKNAIIGLLVGLLTESSSSREPFMEALHRSGLAYFARLRKGSVTVLGAEVDATSTQEALIIGGGSGSPVFDDSAGDAEILGVFAGLGRGPYVDRWRR